MARGRLGFNRRGRERALRCLWATGVVASWHSGRLSAAELPVVNGPELHQHARKQPSMAVLPGHAVAAEDDALSCQQGIPSRTAWQ